MPDARFEEFYRDTATISWPPAEAIARRGRRRRTRQRLAAGFGAAVVAVGIVLAGAAVRGGGPDSAPVPPASPPASPSPSVTGGTAGPSVSPSRTSSPPTSSSAPSLTQVPLAAMLRAADAGPGSWTVTDEANGDYSVFFTFSLCAATNGMRVVGNLHTRERTIGRSDETWVVQRVDAFAPGRAADYLEDVRARVRACGTFTPQRGGDQITVRIVQDGFATADESFVVEVSSGGNGGWHAFARRGALVTEVVVWPSTLTDTLRVGRAAANRLAQAGG